MILKWIYKLLTESVKTIDIVLLYLNHRIFIAVTKECQDFRLADSSRTVVPLLGTDVTSDG